MNHIDINRVFSQQYMGVDSVKFSPETVAKSILIYTRMCEMLYPILANPEAVTVVNYHDEDHPLFINYIYSMGGVVFPYSLLFTVNPVAEIHNFIVNDNKYNSAEHKRYLRTIDIKDSRQKHIEDLNKMQNFLTNLKDEV